MVHSLCNQLFRKRSSLKKTTSYGHYGHGARNWGNGSGGCNNSSGGSNEGGTPTNPNSPLDSLTGGDSADAAFAFPSSSSAAAAAAAAAAANRSDSGFVSTSRVRFSPSPFDSKVRAARLI